MKPLCKLCQKEKNLTSERTDSFFADSLCDACLSQMVDTLNYRNLVEAVDAPILLMQGNPRQVITANEQALVFFGKGLSQVEGVRGGSVFDCIHSFSEAGCGKDEHCENCPIKDAIVDTFVTSTSHRHVSTVLKLKKKNEIEDYRIRVSTEKLADWALVKIEQCEKV
jgi:hypothetical protein